MNAEARSFQCETRLCLVDHFQGRVTCKYGQTLGTDKNCTAPGEPDAVITVAVDPQLKGRTADKAVYCSCRCDGEDKNARYCKCPSGYACKHDIDDIGVGNAELSGSYCIRDGSGYSPSDSTETCAPTGYPKVASTAPSCGTDTGND